MSRNKSHSMKMVATKTKNKVITCSTPEHHAESPSRDSDSDAASPFRFFCTQDGTEGETDVVWNFYTPNSKSTSDSHSKNSTPLSRKTKKSVRPRMIEEQPPRRRPLKNSLKSTELFQELVELNKILPDLLAKKKQNVKEQTPSGNEEDIFNDSLEHSPKTGLRNTSRCLRKNVLSSKFTKPEPEAAIESDDSMNECLIKASQIVEENFVECKPSSPKRVCYDLLNKSSKRDIRPSTDFRMDQDSMDAILNSIQLESPAVSKTKKYDSPKLGNDSFDSFVGNLNDSALEQLTQMPIRSNVSKVKFKPGLDSNWTVKEMTVHDGSPSTSVFARHSSMPESPSVEMNIPSTSGMAFGRFNSMPYDKNEDKTTGLGDSPIRCTPEEIKRKHQLAREKLLAKRLPFTSQKSTQSNYEPSTQHMVKRPIRVQATKQSMTSSNIQLSSLTSQRITPSIPDQATQPVKNTKFQPRQPSSRIQNNNLMRTNHNSEPKINSNVPSNPTSSDIKLLIEKKRQEALMKLRRRQGK